MTAARMTTWAEREPDLPSGGRIVLVDGFEYATTAPKQRLGCEDCGCMWAGVEDVPVACRPYTYVIEPGDGPMGYVWASADEPDWPES